MISKIPVGDYELCTTFIGYDTASVVVKIKIGEVITRKLYIGESSVNLNIFDVSEEKQETKTSSSYSG